MPVAELDRALLSLRSGRCARLRALPFCQLQTKAVYSGKSGYWESVHNYRRLPHSLGEHVRKPDPRIFRLALDISQVDVARVVYIENTPMFAQVGESVGLRSILHTDFRATRAKLAAFGLRDDEGEGHEAR